MPELPDVEVFCRRFAKEAAGHKVRSVEVESKGLVDSSRKLSEHVTGSTLKRPRRHGKYMLVDVGGESLVAHFGMTGYVAYPKRGEALPPHTRVSFDLDDGSKAAFVSQRKLGKLRLVHNADEFIQAKGLGPDALKGKYDLAELLRNKRSAIKSALMNQKLIAGIGNVYADEILYQAGIHPKRPAGNLSEKEVRKLDKTLHRVLEEAVRHNADPERFPKNWLTPHRKTGESCPGCKGKLSHGMVNGRSTYFCETCQR